jgi:hypothetical protein
MDSSHNNGYSLTALSMAAEYQALQGNMSNGNNVHHPIPRQQTVQPTAIDVTFDETQNVMSTNSMMHFQGPTLEESLDSLTSFLDHEPLTSYHFSTLMSAEQPMYVNIFDSNIERMLMSHKAVLLSRVTRV